MILVFSDIQSTVLPAILVEVLSWVGWNLRLKRNQRISHEVNGRGNSRTCCLCHDWLFTGKFVMMSHKKLAKYLKTKTKRLFGLDKEIPAQTADGLPRDNRQGGLYAALLEEQETKERIRRTLECPICTDIMLDPIILECGHTFCFHCFAHDCDRRHSTTLVCCLCRDNISRAVIIARSLREAIQAAFPSEESHRRETLTMLDRQAVARLLASQQKSSISQTVNRHLTRIKYASAGLVIFLAWFFYPEIP
ncbi:hypothetical protein RvY_12423 [Ramazzottius varieornatus]|uniref:RING-type domain-containing protein n=1 Tax=Ramazzottius varieornatus TaxID=947166 RepID=A0A1D1VJG3_RAMVA|nr:hypothetical protein RvY_12423 [Ramazzottius varieornatus]